LYLVPGPVENLQPAGLLREPGAGGVGHRGAARNESRSTGDPHQLEKVVAAKPPLQKISAITHLDSPFIRVRPVLLRPHDETNSDSALGRGVIDASSWAG